MKFHKSRRLLTASIAAMVIAAPLAGCSGTASASGGSGGSGNSITLWTHNAGNPAELAADQKIVSAFNSSQSKYKVTVQAFPQASYNQSVVAAAASGKLPCVLDMDAPNVPNWAWAKYLAPLDLGTSLKGQLPSTIGKWNGKVYAVGYYDVALAMFARKSVLTAAGIRIPTIDTPWTQDEFNQSLAALKKTGKWAAPLDLGTSGTGEWWTYAYSPLLQSFGGDLINRTNYQSADGALNGANAVNWATWMRGLVTQGLIAQKSGADANADLTNNKTAIEYSGSWAAAPLSKTLGKDLAVIPPVNFGSGPKIGGGSWEWGMTNTCENKAAATAYLKFSLQPQYQASVAVAAGTIPATSSPAALKLDPSYGPGGSNEIFAQISRKYAELRPPTPAYPFISTTFTTAAQNILAGADPKSTLDQAVRGIDANIKTNNGYK
ncbi:extracellular solute-binding protein [Arthrobacter sp. STN4]|uniref:sugar ABC transporter substrate-binding protein n=1 Tax=Arthrobacter sp. STN4 TaxID=2923276 RepID=UPI00211A4715|nr:extracellular solute-binding protein [Arthrobacter sp. STN4]MCQ9165167.1 extracellular solute-binding protein [Arthrobacter sp. STN4]